MDKDIERVVRSCTALSQTPQASIEQSSCEPPHAVGISFAAEVLERSRQLILVLWESVTSYTSTMVIEHERHHTLRDALVRLCIQVRPLQGPPAVIRPDPAPGFKSLVNDQLLQHHSSCPARDPVSDFFTSGSARPRASRHCLSLGPCTSEPVDLPSAHTAERHFLPSESVNQPRRSARYDDYVTDF